MTESSKVGPGTVLAERYELVDVIGRGGFGTVWRAQQLNMRREVAIKILPQRFINVEDVVERFKREAMLASRLRHPNTITLHDYGEHEGLLYIVMEILTGEDLADLLQRDGRLPQDRIIHISRQVLKSLAEAHEQHIVHRDLKPENIFLSVVGDDRDHVKVLDFGIAKLAQPTAEDAVDENDRRLTMSGSTVGTPTYMSPEQAAGEEVDGLTDLYALGISMYEMACGRPPFHNKDPVKVMRAQLFEPVPPMRDKSLQGGVLDRVIQKALAKEREQRFQSAHDMLLALAGEPVARPVIQGIPAAGLDLDEPSTQDMVLDEESGPNTDDFEPDREKKFPNTLAFAASVPRGGGEEGESDAAAPASEEAAEADNPDDAVPFASLTGAEERRKRETVRSSVTSSSSLTSDSALNSESGLTPPPAGPARNPDQNGTTTSSILTVIDAGNSDEEDVILLTRKKGREAPAPDETVADDERPDQDTDAERPDRADAHPSGNSSDMLAHDSDDEIPFDSSAGNGVSAPEEENQESWEWGRPDTSLADEAPATRPSNASSRGWIILVILVLVVAAIALFYEELAAMMLRAP